MNEKLKKLLEENKLIDFELWDNKTEGEIIAHCYNAIDENGDSNHCLRYYDVPYDFLRNLRVNTEYSMRFWDTERLQYVYYFFENTYRKDIYDIFEKIKTNKKFERPHLNLKFNGGITFFMMNYRSYGTNNPKIVVVY